MTVDAAAFDAAMARQKEQARAAGKFKMATNLEYDGPATTFHGYDTLEDKGQRAGAVQGRRRGQRAERRRDGRGRARRHAVLRRVRRPGRRSRRAAVGAWHLRRRRHAEDPGHRLRSPRRGQDRHDHGRQRRYRQGRCAGPRAHHAQPLGHPPDAQGAARSARRPRAAEGLAGRSGQDPLRLRA